MADGDNSYPIVHPSIQREIDLVRSAAQAVGRAAEANCKARHHRQTDDFLPLKNQADDDHETIIELVGKSGNNGKVGGLEKTVAKLEKNDKVIEERQKADHDVLTKLQSGQFRYSAAGAGAGGSLLVGIIELVKYLS